MNDKTVKDAFMEVVVNQLETRRRSSA